MSSVFRENSHTTTKQAAEHGRGQLNQLKPLVGLWVAIQNAGTWQIEN